MQLPLLYVLVYSLQNTTPRRCLVCLSAAVLDVGSDTEYYTEYYTE